MKQLILCHPADNTIVDRHVAEGYHLAVCCPDWLTRPIAMATSHRGGTMLLPHNKQMFRAYAHCMCICKHEVVKVRCEVIHKIHGSVSVCQAATMLDVTANTCSFFVAHVSHTLSQ